MAAPTVPTYAVTTELALESGVVVLVTRVVARRLIDRKLPASMGELPDVRIDIRWQGRIDVDVQTSWLRAHAAGLLSDV